MNTKFKSIETIINARLKLQSTQKSLMDKFDIYLPSVNYLKFIVNKIDIMDKQEQKNLVVILGGKANLKLTFEYLNSLKTEKINA